MTPPGVGIVWAGPRALAAHRDADLRTRYWDWTYRTEDGPYYLRFCGTPPVSHLFGLREALRMIAEEGLEARWDRHRVLGRRGARRRRRMVGRGRSLAARDRERPNERTR